MKADGLQNEIERLIDEGLKVDSCVKDGMEDCLPIEVAITGYHIEAFDFLLAKGFYRNLTLSQQKKVISTAIIQHIASPTSILENLIESTSVDTLLNIMLSENLYKKIHSFSVRDYPAKVLNSLTVLYDAIINKAQKEELSFTFHPNVIRGLCSLSIFLDSKPSEIEKLLRKIISMISLFKLDQSADLYQSRCIYSLYTDSILVKRLCRWQKLDLYRRMIELIDQDNFPKKEVCAFWEDKDDTTLGKNEMLLILR
jgi:hypothetical protein